MSNRIQVFPVTATSNKNLDEAVNGFLDLCHRAKHKVVDIKYSIAETPLSEGMSQTIQGALVIYEEGGKNAKPEK